MTPDGCPISDIAPNRAAQSFVDGFISYTVADSEAAKAAIAEEHALLADVELYCKLESEIRAYRSAKRKESAVKGKKRHGKRPRR